MQRGGTRTPCNPLQGCTLKHKMMISSRLTLPFEFRLISMDTHTKQFNIARSVSLAQKACPGTRLHESEQMREKRVPLLRCHQRKTKINMPAASAPQNSAPIEILLHTLPLKSCIDSAQLLLPLKLGSDLLRPLAIKFCYDEIAPGNQNTLAA